MRQPMLRWRRLRHGGHQVNSASLSGSGARPDVDQPGAHELRDRRSLYRTSPDLVRFALLGMHVALLARDGQVAAQHQRRTRPRARTWTFAIVAVTLVVVALAACAMPAWRATRINPAKVLRGD
jgi:hypothetical protein